MVAFISSNDLGLFTSALGLPAMPPDTRSAEVGRSNEQVYVNVASGNLVVQRQDDALIGQGPDVALVRTYNSQAQFTDDNGDNWRLGIHKRVYGLTGTLNENGSTISRTDGDGTDLVYHYDASRGMYINRDGAGSVDTLAFDSSANQWIWTDGDSRVTERYDWMAGRGKLLALADLDGNTVSYTYTGEQLTLVTDASGEKTYLDYVGANLAGLRTVKSDGATLTRVRYEYDVRNRLAGVTIDLTPEDNNVADGNVYLTRYTYDGDSTRIAGISQSDGTQVDFTYATLADGSVRVSRISQAVDGGSRVSHLGYDIVSRKTTITDPLGNKTVYAYDAEGRLTQLTGPALAGGESQTISYAYDADGNVAAQTDARGHTVSYEYDGNGNLTLQRDAAGNTVLRTYGSRNELLTETLYILPDPDGAGTAEAGQPQTSHYVYDANNHLRFSISAEGRVTEYRYNGQGQRTSTLQYTDATYDLAITAENLAGWIAGGNVDQSRVMRTDTAYDFRGQVSTVTRYAKADATGAGIADGTHSMTRYVYDQSGQLLQTVAPKGEATSTIGNGFITTYTYDGLGRLLSTTDSLNNVTLNQYNDAARTTRTTIANGLATTSTYNQAGDLISVIQANGAAALGETRYWYDANGHLRMTQDPTGGRNYALYDETGRKVAEIDANGSLTEYRYNGNNQLTLTIRYATAVSSTSLASLVDAGGNPANVTLAELRPAASSADRRTWNLYDQAGRLVKTVDELGYVTEVQYDGASRVTASIRYATPVSTVAIMAATQAGDPMVSPVADAAHDRRTRTFYDRDGNVLAMLDADGYLTERQYDAAGRLVHTVSYANQTGSTHWYSGSLADLRPAANDAQDSHAWNLYDGQGRLIGSVDGEGYLTETVFDVNGHPTQQIRYANKAKIAPDAITTETLLGNLRPTAHAQDRVTSWTYTDLNQVKTRTNPEGTVTQYSYDGVGNLVKTDKAFGTTEARTLQAHYDQQGRLTGELTAEGSAALSALAAPTQAQIDAIWAQYGISHAYDQAGRKTSSTDQNGNKTLYYYDADGQLVYVINALGEVTENGYDALGQLAQTIRYGTRLAGTTLSTLTGGLANSTVATAVNALANTALDSKTGFSYDLRGQVVTRTDELGNVNSVAYNAFGDIRSTTERIDAGTTVTTAYEINKKGQRTRTTEDVGGLNRITQAVYDAFGRTVRTTDAQNQIHNQQYDRLGRMVQTTDSLGIGRTTTYDAFDRVLTQTDGNGNTTTTVYNKTDRSVTVTTAEGISITTKRNRHGDTVQLLDGRGNSTSYSYDRNGNLTRTTNDALGITESKRYDNANLLIDTTDGNGVETAYSYDAAGRLLTRTVDPTGLALTTTYGYDAKGRMVSVIDANGVVTQSTFDLKGQVTQVAVDPAGLNLRTTYSYDARGKTLTVTEGAGTDAARVTRYTYDALGRRTREVVDPDGLNITILYAYDGNGNLVSKTDAAGNVTRYSYDAGNRLVYTVDPIGGVTENGYDAEGRIVLSVRYARPIAVSSLSGSPSLDDIRSRLVPDAADQASRTVYDKDGLAVYELDALNQVTQKTYDGNGNVIRVTQYAASIIVPATLTPSTMSTAVTAIAGNDDRVTRYVFDAGNRLAYTISAIGAITEHAYDASGNLVKTVAYAKPVNLSGDQTMATMQAAVAANADAANDRRTLYVLDNARRVVYSIDAMGYVQQREYDATGRVVKTIRYTSAIAAGGNPTLASVAALLPASIPASAVVERQTYDAAGRLVDTIDGASYITRRAYDAAGRVVEITQAYGTADASTTRRSYDEAGRMLAETKAYGTAEAIITRYGYDANGNVLATVDARGVELAEQDTAWALAQRQSLGYKHADGSAKLVASLSTAEQDALRALYTTTQVFDAAGQKIQVIDALGGTTSTVYDAFGNAVKVTDPRGNSGYFYFDRLNRTTLQVDPEGYVTRTTYTVSGKPASVTQYANRATGTWTEDTEPVVLTAAPTGTSPAAYVVQASATDQVTLFDYDKLDNLVKSTDAEGYYEAYTYDGLGNRTSARNKVGGVTRYAYDARGKLIAETLPVTSANAAGQQVAVVNQYQYDARGNRIKTIEAVGLPEQRVTTFEFDPLNRQVRKIGEALTVFDPLTQATSTVTPVETYKYDARGNVIETTDANGKRTLAYYDALDRKTAELNAVGTLTTYRYSAGKEPIATTTYGDSVALPAVAGASVPAPVNAANARETLYEYDRNERLMSTTVKAVSLGRYDAVSGQYQLYTADVVTRQIYDANGNVIQTIDGNGNTTTSFYNEAGQKILQVDAEGYGIAWAYDLNGNALRERRYAAKYPSLVTTASDAGALLGAWPASADDRITDYTYDRNGRLLTESRLNVTYAAVDSTGGAFTQAVGSATTRYAYNGLGKIVQKTDANGDVTHATYDSVGRKTREQGAAFVDFEGATVRPTTDAEYNGLNDVVRSIRRGKNDTTEADDQITRYTYGNGGRLLSETDPAGTTTYAYDAAGNVTRKQRPRTNADGVATTDTTLYRYDSLNREIEHSDVGTGVSQQTRYNAYGEISAKGTNGGWQEFAEYDKAGRVFKSNSGSGVTKAYVYDAAGNATLTIESSGPELKGMALDQMLGLSNGSPNPDALDAAGVHLSVSVFDRRNQLTDTFAPKMVTKHEAAGVQSSTSTVQLPQGSYTGTTVALGAASQVTSVAVSNSIVQGAANVTAGNVSEIGDISANGVPWLSPTTTYSNVQLTLPAEINAWGGGNTLIVVDVYYPQTNRLATFTHTFPATQNIISLQTAIGFAYDLYSDQSNSQTITVYKQTPYGNVQISQSKRTYTEQTIRTAFSTPISTPIPKLVHFKGQSTSADRLLMWYRYAGSSGPYQQVTVPKYMMNGSAVSGWFAFGWAGLSLTNYDIKYVALDAAGNILNQETGSMTLSDTAPSITQTPQAFGPAQPGSYFFQSGMYLNVTAQGANASSMVVRYRPVGSTGVWSTAIVGMATFGGAAIPGWFQWRHSALVGDYDVIFESRTATGATINKVYSTVRLAFNGGPSTFLAGITPYQNRPSTVTFSGNPTDATRMQVSYRPQGSTGAYSTATIASPTAAGSGTFYWDASALVPYDQTNFQYEFVYEATNAAGQVVNKGGGSFQLGTTPAMLSQYVSPRPPVLSFTPVHAGAARMQLQYRVRGSKGDYLAAPALTKGADGKFSWDVSALKPATGSADYEYFYDLFDANGAILARTPGYFTLGETNSANELKWVVTGLVGAENVIHRSQRVNAFGEVIQEIDGLGRATDFAYNTLGKLTSKLGPQTTATLDNGFIQTVRPQTRYDYDRLGQTIAVLDANGNLNTQAWLAGDMQKVRAERHADGGIKTSAYDIFGNQRVAIDEIQRRTDYTYDHASRLVRLDRPQREAGSASYLASRSFETYEYDAAGNRIAHTNTLGFREKTYYDSLGRVTQITSNAGRVTSTSYAYIGSILGVGGRAVGGFQKITTDANGRSLIDHQDVFGRLTWHQDLGGRTSTYAYNNAGWLTAQTSSGGQHITYDYYGNGFIKNIRDHAEHTLTSYEYDQEGNKTFEGYVVLNADNTTVRDYYQQATIAYDELNRVKTVTDPRYTISYEYDAVGNRRRVTSTYHDGVDGSKQTQDYWYKYDSMNRFTVTMGSLSGARATTDADNTVSITQGATGVALAYDNAGQRRQATRLGQDGIMHTEAYGYTADGYLEDTKIDGLLRARRTNDALGRVSTYSEYSTAGALTYSRSSEYDADNLSVRDSDNGGSVTTYGRFADGTLEYTSNTNNGTTISTYYGYEWWDSAKESTITLTPYNASRPGWKSGYSHMRYDANGHLKEARDEVGNRSFRYVSNAEGLVLLRDEIAGGTVNKVHKYYYLDGKRIGDIGNDGPTRSDYVQALARDRNIDRKQAYKNFKPISSADFDQNYEPINASYPGATPGSYTVRSGDTLQSIAAQMWGDASMWYLLADANGLTGQEALTAGTTLSIPNKVTNIHNTGSTFRVYNAGEAIGDTSPTLPEPPPPPSSGKKGKCGGFATILVIVVAIVATVLTAGAAAMFLGAAAPGMTVVGAGMAALGGGLASVAGFAAAMIGGAVGSIASQGVGMALGVQDKFSWSAVATSAVGAGVGAGMGGLIQGPSLGATMGRAVAGNVLTQGVSVAAGLQKKFDWRGVAASALGSAAGHGMGQALSGADWLTRGTAMGIANGGVRSFVTGQKANWGAIAAESFGSTLGNGLVESLKSNSLDNSTANAAVKKKDLTDDLKKLGAVQAGALDIASRWNDASARAEMAAQLGGNERLEQFIAAYKDNLKSEDVYLDYASTDIGMQEKVRTMQETLDAFGISRVSDEIVESRGYKIRDDNSGFRAALYRDDNADSFSVAFRGTEFAWNDIKTDILNALGIVTEQYEQAAKLASELSLDFEYSRGLSFTGHSLGGGLATVAAAATGLNANTFNAASVHPEVATKLFAPLENNNGRVNHYFLQGEVVSRLQDSVVVDALGVLLTPAKWISSIVTGSPSIMPSYLPEVTGQRIPLTGWLDNESKSSWGAQLGGTLGLHSNQAVIKSFERLLLSPAGAAEH